MMTNRGAAFVTYALGVVLASACGPDSGPVGASRDGVHAARPNLVVTTSLVFRSGLNAVITGRVTNVPVGHEEDYRVVVQGQTATADVLVPGEIEWESSVPLDGPSSGGSFPYASFYSAGNRVAMPLLIELVELPDEAVVVRRKYRLYDLRMDPDLELAESDAHLERLAGQLTTRGLDRLERTHLPTLPPPDLSTFNDLLSDSYSQPVQEIDLPTSILDPNRTCFRLDQVNDLFGGVPAVTGVKALALLQQGAYNAAASSGVGAAALSNFCVTGKDDVYDNRAYEVCIGGLRGTLDHADVLSADYVDLAVGNDVRSTVVLGNIDQIVDLEFTDVSVRWARKPLCTMRALVTTYVSDEVLMSDPERAAWARCEDTNARALEATSDPFASQIEEGRVPDLLAVRSTATDYVIETADRTVTALSNHCAAANFSDEATQLLEQYFPILEDALGTAWSQAVPNNAYADALDALFVPFEHGSFDVGLDHDLESEITDRGVIPGADGLAFLYNANAEVRSDFAIIPAPATFVCPDAISPLLSPDGLSEHAIRVPFDVLFSTTTCALNQVLREEHATARVNFTFPTEAGQALSTALASVDTTGLAALTSTSVEWRMSPTLPAWTWMGPHAPMGEFLVPIAYHHYDLRLEAYDGADRLLALRLDFLDPDFRLNLNHTLGATVAEPKLGGRNFAVTVAASDLPACPMAPHDETERPLVNASWRRWRWGCFSRAWRR